jgi:hypothetical protein
MFQACVSSAVCAARREAACSRCKARRKGQAEQRRGRPATWSMTQVAVHESLNQTHRHASTETGAHSTAFTQTA